MANPYCAQVAILDFLAKRRRDLPQPLAQCRPPHLAPPVCCAGAQDGKMGRLSPEYSCSYVVTHLAPLGEGRKMGARGREAGGSPP